MKIDIINKNNYILSLTNDKYFTLIGIDGQTLANSSISSIVIGGADGDIINNIQVQPRTLIFTLRIKNTEDVETSKRHVLRVIKIKQEVCVRMTQNERTAQIFGIVESVNIPRWQDKVSIQITLHCEQPFWEDVKTNSEGINEINPLHYFTPNDDDMLFFPDGGIPFGEYDFTRSKTIINNGDVSVGIDIEIVAHKTVVNPVIYDKDGNFFGIGFGDGIKKLTMNAGDVIKITTQRGNKTVKMNGESIIGKIKPYSTWLQLEAGENQFLIDSDNKILDNMTFSISFTQRYI